MASLFPASINEPSDRDSRGRIQTRIRMLARSGWGSPRIQRLDRSQLQTRGLAEGQELLKNVGAVLQHFLLRDAVLHSEEQKISAGANSWEIKNSHRARGSLRHGSRGEPSPQPHVFDSFKDAV